VKNNCKHQVLEIMFCGWLPLKSLSCNIQFSRDAITTLQQLVSDGLNTLANTLL